MKSKFYPTSLLVALLVCSSARATLIGDTINISLQSPLGTSYFSANTIGQVGAGDQVTLNGLPLVADPEASKFSLYNISLVSSILFPNVGGFNGLVVTGIDDTISIFSITTTLVGWNDSRLTFDAHSFTADFRDITFPTTNGLIDLEISLWCITINPTPEAGGSAGFLAAGFLGLAVASRWFKKSTGKHCR